MRWHLASEGIAVSNANLTRYNHAMYKRQLRFL
jgi:hypothetical protein